MISAHEAAEMRASCALRLEMRERLVAKHGDTVPPASVLVDVAFVLRMVAHAEREFCPQCAHCAANRGAGGAALGG